MGDTILANNSQFIFTSKPPYRLLYIYNSPSTLFAWEAKGFLATDKISPKYL